MAKRKLPSLCLPTVGSMSSAIQTKVSYSSVAVGTYSAFGGSTFAILSGLGAQNPGMAAVDGGSSLLVNTPGAAEYVYKAMDFHNKVSEPGRARKVAGVTSIVLAIFTTLIGLGLTSDAVFGLKERFGLSTAVTFFLFVVVGIPSLTNNFLTRWLGSYDLLAWLFEGISENTRRSIHYISKSGPNPTYRLVANDIENHKDIFKLAILRASNTNGQLVYHETEVLKQFYLDLHTKHPFELLNSKRNIFAKVKSWMGWVISWVLFIGSGVMIPIFIAKASGGLLSLAKGCEYLMPGSAFGSAFRYLSTSSIAVGLAVFPHSGFYGNVSRSLIPKTIEFFQLIGAALQKKLPRSPYARAGVASFCIGVLAVIGYASGEGFFREATVLSQQKFDNEKGFTQLTESFLRQFLLLDAFNYACRVGLYPTLAKIYSGLIVNGGITASLLIRKFLQTKEDNDLDDFISTLRVRDSHHADAYDYKFEEKKNNTLDITQVMRARMSYRTGFFSTPTHRDGGYSRISTTDDDMTIDPGAHLESNAF